MKKSIVVGCVFLFLIFTLSSGNGVAPQGGPESTVTSNNEHLMAPAASYTPHGPITIISNSDFSSQGWPGNGILGDPYIIEGLNITADAVCINIIDTTVYFEVRDCVISSESVSIHDGIILENVTHGTIQDCIIDMHYNGISLMYLSNCTLTDNTAFSNHFGFYVFISDNCTLTGNAAFSNDYYGFYLRYCSVCTIKNNTLVDNGVAIFGGGISEWFHDVSGNTVNSRPLGYFVNLTSTTIDGAQYGQVILVNCFNVTVQDGVFINASIGIQLSYCTNCNLKNSTASCNTYGFRMFRSLGCTLTNNTASCNLEYGFDLRDSGGSNLTTNTAISNANGFNLEFSEGCIITSNTASSNSVGFNLHYSNGSTITSNTASSNSLGFYLFATSSCALTNNTLVDNGVAIFGGSISYWLHDVSGNTVNSRPLGYFVNLTSTTIDGAQYGQVILVNCFNVTVQDGVFINASIGIQLGFCTNCSVRNNTASSNALCGFSLSYSSVCTLMGNAATSNSFGFYLEHSYNCTLKSNTASYNVEDGFRLNHADNCTLMHNTASYNVEVGLVLYSSEYNMLYLNRFGNNGLDNAVDSGEFNIWDDSVSSGNYWMDYDGTGTYPIPGSAGSVDNYPFVWDIAVPTVDSPADFQYNEFSTGNSITWHPSDLYPHSYVIYMDSSPVKSGAWNSSSESITISIDGLGLGTYNYTIVVIDVGGNSAIDTVLVTVMEAITTATTTTPTTTTTTTIETSDIMLILILSSAGFAVVVIVIIVVLRKRGA